MCIKKYKIEIDIEKLIDLFNDQVNEFSLDYSYKSNALDIKLIIDELIKKNEYNNNILIKYYRIKKRFIKLCLRKPPYFI